MTIRPAPKPSPREKRPRKPLKQGRVRTVNASRRKKEFARAYHSRARVAWVKAQDCQVPGMTWHSGPVENAHVVSGGRGRKADARFILPLCQGHHRELHAIGNISFCVRYNIASLIDLTVETERRWLAYQEGK